MSPHNDSTAAIKAQYPVHRLHGVILLLLLIVTMLLGMGNSLHSRLLWLGEQTWQGYYLLDPWAEEPTCRTDIDVDSEVQRRLDAYVPDPDDLFASPPNPDALRQSLLRNIELCQERFERFERNQESITTTLTVYKTIERGMASFLLENIDLMKFLFMGMFALAAAIAAFESDHIALRLPRNRSEWRLNQGAQLFVNGLMVLSLLAYIDRMKTAPGGAEIIKVQYAWVVIFAGFILVNLYRMVNIPSRIIAGPLGIASGLAIPLYVYMGLIAMSYFFFADGYTAGLAIYFNLLASHSTMFINIGLYVLVGMALKQTRIPQLLFDAIKPFNLPAPALASLIIFATAFPTAFTGASGIFILAVGGIIYDELRRAGAGRQLSLATTAMSGSLGVVLNPCLLIVVIAALNREVTTSEMYSWGFWIFIMSATLYSIVVCTTHGNWRPKPVPGAGREFLKLLRPLLPYVITGAVVIIAVRVILGLKFNEFTAPLILPVLMLALVALDSGKANRDPGETRMSAFWNKSTIAASDSAVHIGALIGLIGFSICFGGIMERSEVISQIFPDSAGNVWMVMAVILVMLTLIGMFMDPFAAVILVSATISQAAFQVGVDPLHFWLVCLVSFELGYLTPPVALNHLLTRQVVGEREVLAIERTGSFWFRYERLVLPFTVMFISLVLVGYMPLIAGLLGFGPYAG